MATTPTAMPDQGQSAASSGGGAPASSPTPDSSSSSPSQAPASQIQMLLAKWYQVAKQMAASDPRLAPGAEKISQGIQEMQTALVSPPQPQSLSQQPTY